MSRYCKGCKSMVQEQHLYKEHQCPTCGKKLDAPFVSTVKRQKYVAKSFDILVEYNDKVTNELKTVVYTDVDEEYYNKIKYTANNVVKVTVLTREV
jgi:hypothetical protein